MPPATRRAAVSRVTAETSITGSVDLDDALDIHIATGVAMLDELLFSFASEAALGLTLTAAGDLHIDEHHTVEDCGLVLGELLAKALGDKAGIVRAGSADAGVADAQARAVVDLSGRPYAVLDLQLVTERVRGLETDLVRHFLESLAVTARTNISISVTSGHNDEHKLEAIVRALGRATRDAVAIDARRMGEIPSTKGVI